MIKIAKDHSIKKKLEKTFNFNSKFHFIMKTLALS